MLDFSKITQYDIESLGEDGIVITTYDHFIIVKNTPRTFSFFFYDNGKSFMSGDSTIWELANIYPLIHKLSE